MKRVLRLVAASLLAATTSLAFVSPAQADTYRDQQWHLPFLKIAEVHKISQGEGITVAVIDTGIEAKHPDLVNNVLPGLDVAQGGSGNGWGDTDGHGTGMAGLIAAHGHGSNNGDGVLGIAPKAKIFPIRAQINAGGAGVPADVVNGQMLYRALEEAINRGAKVVSISMKIPSGDQAVEIQRLIERSNIVVVAAAGNTDAVNLLAAPANFLGVLAIGAVDQSGNIAKVSVQDPRIALSAPGVDIVSSGRINPQTGNQYRKGTGTSPSTAIVAGAAALLWSKNPQWTKQDVIRQLEATATDKGAPGQDEAYGFGIVDPLKALTTPLVAASQTAVPSATATATAAAAPDRKSSNTALFLGIGAVVVVAVLIGGFFLLRRRPQ